MTTIYNHNDAFTAVYEIAKHFTDWCKNHSDWKGLAQMCHLVNIVLNVLDVYKIHR